MESSSRKHPVKFNEKGQPIGFYQHVANKETITYEIIDSIGVITLSRPKRLNAFDEQMVREMRDVIWYANFDDSVKVLLITGDGRAFCAGRDIDGLDYENNLSTAGYRAFVRVNHELFDDIEAIEKPVIAAINGVCAGGGVEMAAACDFRVAAKSATFLLPENQLGLIPASGAASRLIQMIGIGWLKEMMIAATPLDADTARSIGLITRLYDDATFLEEAMNFARSLTDKAPQAMGMSKQVINMCQNVDLETGRFIERLGQTVMIQTRDNKEGMDAFRAKRKPKFTGFDGAQGRPVRSRVAHDRKLPTGQAGSFRNISAAKQRCPSLKIEGRQQ